MSYQKSELYFISALLAGMFILVFFIFQPFIYALILALIFATVFAPVHKRILAMTRRNNGLAALLSTMGVLVVIVVPLTFLSTQIFKEATQLYSSIVSSGGGVSVTRELEMFLRNAGVPFLPTAALDFSQYLKQGLSPESKETLIELGQWKSQSIELLSLMAQGFLLD